MEDEERFTTLHENIIPEEDYDSYLEAEEDQLGK